MPAQMPQTQRTFAPAQWASSALSEAVMGFLALVALATAVGPLVFEVSAEAERFLDVVEAVILSLFVIDFIVQYAVAEDRQAWLRSPWRIIDIVCIGGPLLSLLPQVSDTVRGALVFRFLRVGRAVMFGARAGALAVQSRRPLRPAPYSGPTRVTVVAPSGDSPTDATWSDLLAERDQPAWFHASGLDRQRLLELASLTAAHDGDRAHSSDPGGPPHVKHAPGRTIFSLWLPTAAAEGFPEVSRNRLVMVLSTTSLVTATSFPFDLQRALHGDLDASGRKEEPFPVRAAYDVLALLRDRHAFVTDRHEEELRHVEARQANGGGANFLNEAFRLQREIADQSADLWRLKVIVHKLAAGKVPLPGTDTRSSAFFDDVATEIDGLFEQSGSLREALKSLMEFHMNVTSFEMNKFMKLLAVVGFLGLIPSVAGGLLGMNVIGNPWSVTLGQVAFGIGMSMAISLYAFAMKGWLR